MVHCVVYYTVCSKCVSIRVLEAFTQVQWFDRHWNERWYIATECVTAAHECSPLRAVQYIAMQCSATQCSAIQFNAVVMQYKMHYSGVLPVHCVEMWFSAVQCSVM